MGSEPRLKGLTRILEHGEDRGIVAGSFRMIYLDQPSALQGRGMPGWPHPQLESILRQMRFLGRDQPKTLDRAVRDISGQDVLSRFPKLQLSADFSGIDLGALTRRLDFGSAVTEQ